MDVGASLMDEERNKRTIWAAQHICDLNALVSISRSTEEKAMQAKSITSISLSTLAYFSAKLQFPDPVVNNIDPVWVFTDTQQFLNGGKTRSGVAPTA
jgi:hypothetical protein